MRQRDTIERSEGCQQKSGHCKGGMTGTPWAPPMTPVDSSAQIPLGAPVSLSESPHGGSRAEPFSSCGQRWS